MSNLEKVKDFFIQVWNYIKNKKVAIFIGILIIVGTQIFQNITNEKTNSAMDSFKDIKIDDCIITPIAYDDSQSISRTLQETRDYSEKYGSDILYEGFTINLFLRNEKSKQMSISESSVVIDNIKKIENPQVYLFGIYDDTNNIFSLYLVNNNCGKLDEGLVKITGGYVDITTGYKEDLSNEIINQFFNTEIDSQVPIIFKDLRGGEIRRISSYKLELDTIEDSSLIGLGYEISNNGRIIKEGEIGNFNKYDGVVSYSFSAGEAPNLPIEKFLLVDVEEDNGKSINIPTNFFINEEGMQSISYVIYPTSSCLMKFHIDMKDTNNKHIKSDTFEQEVFVPLYEDNGLFWFKLRDFIQKYEIDTYYYNSNPSIQKEIDYSPSNRDTDYSLSDSEDGYNPENY